MKDSFQNWGDLYSIEFDIVVNKLPSSSVVGVFRFTGTDLGNVGMHGDRIPLLMITKAGKFAFRSSVGDNYGKFGLNFDIVIGKKYHIVIQQLKSGSKYWYKIYINDVLEEKIENDNPRSFPNVKLYTSDSFYESFNKQLGHICNLKIVQGGGE